MFKVDTNSSKNNIRPKMNLPTEILLICFGGCIAFTEGQVCPTGWFGADCQFQCHCNNNVCDINGKCQDGRKCDYGWFGPQCQYQDLGVLPRNRISTNPPHDGTVLTDNDDETCIRNINNIAVEFDEPYPLFWLRVVGTNLTTVNVSSLQFKERNSAYSRICDGFKMYVSVDQSVAEIFCTTNVNAAEVQLHFGFREICSFYISGGRNLALKRLTYQSSDLTVNGFTALSSYAVDGNHDVNFASNSCAHTSNDIHDPNWQVRFPNPVFVNRIVIYNRKDRDTGCCPLSLNGFNLKLYKTFEEVYSYNDTSTKKYKSYTVIEPSMHRDMDALIISVINSDRTLVLCEVEVYGYDICPARYYGLECNKTCNCADVSESCNVQTGACVSGCPPDFRGEACDIDCRSGSMDIECYPPCNSSCINSLCDRITGKCLIDCNDSNSTALECTQVCSANVYDQKCRYMCHCTNNECDTSGSCLPGSTCERGWFGTACQYQDLAANGNILTSPQHSPDHIIDGDDSTCILDLDYIQASFPVPLAFTWVRLVVLEHDKEHTQPTIQFAYRQTGAVSSCLNMLEDKLDRRTTDYYCDLNTLVDYINVTLPNARSVCSFHVSGGRNIAVNLKEYTRQSSNYVGSNYNSVGSSNAVDGLIKDGDQCARTALRDPHPFWNITLPLPHIVTRFVVYNGVSVSGTRQGFTVIAEDIRGLIIFQQSVSANQSFNVIPVPNLSVAVKYVRIEPAPSADKLLTLCEVEVYGEVVCPDGWFGPECDRKCNCANPSETCLVSSGGCQFGCAPGYKGEGCSQPCSPGTWGIGCFSTCNEDCVNDECDSVNGTCIREHPAPHLNWFELEQDVKFTDEELKEFLGKH
ncbi:unnamed protein product [Lymnaea stagnalis]|uniref:Fucolectin tachylectin-4 pentraxin-1 domain-containing protein n=1 Tax=Lymnaea stagnalis TaxID=6523 RepID=A0AAV2HS57_LYMST